MPSTEIAVLPSTTRAFPLLNTGTVLGTFRIAKAGVLLLTSNLKHCSNCNFSIRLYTQFNPLGAYINPNSKLWPSARIHSGGSLRCFKPRKSSRSASSVLTRVCSLGFRVEGTLWAGGNLSLVCIYRGSLGIYDLL